MYGQWNDPIYFKTAGTVLLLLFASAILVFPFRERNNYMQVSWASLKSWLIVAPLLFAVFALDEPWPLTTLGAFALLGSKVFFQLMGLYNRSYFVFTCYIGILFLMFCVWTGQRELYNVVPMAVMGVSCLVPLLRNNFVRMIQYISLTQMAFVFLGWSFLHLAWIVKSPYGLYELMYLIILTEFCDNTNLALCRTLGGRPIFDRIDRRRTFASTLFAAGLTVGLAFAMRHLLPVHAEDYWLMAGLIASIGGLVGDMVMTVIRKDAGIKVVGIFILGRGDFLHRMDRLIFVAPLYYYLMIWLRL